MIGRLTGSVVEQHLDGACILDVNGVGYEVYVPLGALGRLPEAPAKLTLHVHTNVREDDIVLYGFPSAGDRAAFRTLLSVNGVGPKVALGILSHMDANELADAVQRGDKARFKNVSGVGKKIVERLMLELKDKLHIGPAGVPSAPARSAPAAPKIDGPLGVVQGALVQMGYKPVEAERAVGTIREAADGKPPEDLLREALAVLA